MSNAFETLGLEASFDLTEDQIQRAYLKLAARVHPDRCPQAGEQVIATLNDAQRVLSDPESRANALLEALGGPGRASDTSLPAGFLIEIMEIRENLDAARDGGDPGELARGLESAHQERDGSIALVRRLFKELGDPPAESGLREIRTILNAWRYIERLIEQIEPQSESGR